MQTADHLFWPSLLDKIQEGRVIPIVGPHLAELEVDGCIASIQSHLARRLASSMNIDASDPSVGGPALFDVLARAHKVDSGADYHSQVNRLLRSMGKPAVPPALASLARITDFKLFVNLGFDELLNQALEEERGSSGNDVRHLAYAPNQRRTDLPAPLDEMSCQVVYALLGKSCAAPEFVISDDDLLEWVTALQDPDNRPPLLFDALRTNHLLFIGCHLQDWLMRFLIRLTRDSRISLSRASETLVGPEPAVQGQLVSFLNGFSPKTVVIEMPPVQFVAELESRWLERTASLANSTPSIRWPEDIRPGGVFLSYASEDAETAGRVHQTLLERQVDTWFDAHRLSTGSHYEQVISRNIGRCGVMMPIITGAVLNRLAHWRDQDGFHPDKKPYFMREWELAMSRQQMQPRAISILPVRTADVDLSSPLLPAGLRALSFGYAPAGVLDAGLLDAVKQNVREARKQLREAV